MFLQTVANVLLYSPRTSLFPSLPFDIHSQPFPSPQRTSFESLLLLVNSLACWKHWGEKKATHNAGYVLRYSPEQPPGQAPQLVLRAIWGPPYPGDEGSLWNDELKRVDLFLPLWKQFLLVFICLVQLSISSSALLSAPLYLGWWWAAPASTQGCVAVTVRPCYWCKRGWLNWCCPKFPLCLQPWTWPSNVSFWFWQFPIVIREITLGGNWMKDTQQLSWLFSFSTSCFAVRIRLVKLWFFILPLGVTSDYLHSLSKLPIYKMKIMMEAVECIEGVTFIQHLGQ